MVAPRIRLVGVVVAVAAALAVAAGCGSSGGGDGARPTLPSLSTTTTASSGASTTTTRETTTTTRPSTTTTTDGRSTTTTSTVEPTTTTTEARTTTTTKPKDTTTTSAAAGTTTTIDSGLASDTIASGESDVPWLAIGALAALLVLVLVVALRRRSERQSWWSRAEALVRDGRALVDVGAAGPAGADPQQQIAHWGTLEQRTQAMANEVEAVLGAGPPDDTTRAAVAGLGQAVSDYLAALRTSRTLRIGPPAPTAEQLQYADAESNQRLAVVRANLDQLDQLVVPHRADA